MTGSRTDGVFDSTYASAYDLFYQDKDYAAECDLIEEAFRRFGSGEVRRVLDLGCGTGNHAVPLAERGYRVTGVDRSPDMLARARAKAEANGLGAEKVAFEQGDITRPNVAGPFDAALMLFAVLGYQPTNADVLSALAAARAALRPGGLFLYDVWYGPAVLRERPSDRFRVFETPEGQVLRAASGDLDVHRHLVTVRLRLWRIEHGRLVAQSEEHHPMRYFFPLELDLFLQQSGFEPLTLAEFPHLDRPPGESSWNVFGVARAR